MQIFDIRFDEVIKSAVASGVTTYSIALDQFYPLIDRFEEQRKLQRPKFYERLKRDIISGCIMPPITLAFISEDVGRITNTDLVLEFVEANFQDGYILDGMQRLNTLRSASEEEGFDAERPLHFNIVVSSKYDLLLYRMITLNNGQKPMTVRHQVEMLTGNLIKKMISDDDLKNMQIVSEKETESTLTRGAFKLSDVAAAYLSFLTNSAHNQNSRFIEEKLDEILVGKVMSSGAIDSDVSFRDIIEQVDRLSAVVEVRDWLRNENNLIGFTLGAKSNMVFVDAFSPVEFKEKVDIFEAAFLAINPSKVNVGKFRRDLSKIFILEMHQQQSIESLTEKFFEVTAN